MIRYLLPPIHAVDRFLNGITMYKVVLYALLVDAAFAILFSALGILSYKVVPLLLLLAIVTASCAVTNWVFAKIFRVPANTESWFITALILFFLFSPILQSSDMVIAGSAGVIAMASKYLLAWRGKHIFNPAALAAVALGFSGATVWWIGTPVLLPVTLITGLLIVRKIRRFPLFWTCIAASFVVVIVLGLQNNVGVIESVTQHLLSWPIVFFASVMVTEPLTMPPRRGQQMFYGGFVGALSSWPIVIGPVFFTPELALLIGNLYAYAVSLRRRLMLRLRDKREIARDTYEFAFTISPPMRFLPGQYLEWTLPHSPADVRGNRRYFTMASSPTEDDLLLGVKIGAQHSSYKKQLLAMQKGDMLYAGQLGGDFVLPKNAQEKLVFIAGGIGITPFRSIIKYLMDTNEKRDVILFYSNRSTADIAYRDVLEDAAQSFGLRTIYVMSENADGAPKPNVKRIDEATIRKYVDDFAQRTFFLSGPTGMVDAYKELLQTMGVPRGKIVTDYFPGFA